MAEFNFSHHRPEAEDNSLKDFKQIEDAYLQLEKKQQSLFQKEKFVYTLSHLEAEGLQAVFRDYGATAVIDNATALYTKTTTGQFSLLQVIQRIEPSKEKRKILFEKMEGNARFIGDKIDEAGDLDGKIKQGRETIPENYFKNTYSYGDHFLYQSKNMINELKEQDNFLINIYNRATLQTNLSVFPNLIDYLIKTDSQSEFIDEINKLNPDTSIYDLTQIKFQEVADEKEKLNLKLKQMREELQDKSQMDGAVMDIVNKIINLENSTFIGNPGSLNQDNYYPISF